MVSIFVIQINKEDRLLISRIHRLNGRERELNQQLQPSIIVRTVTEEARSTMGTPDLN